MSRRGAVYLLAIGVPILLYLFGPQLATWSSPKADTNQHECLGGHPEDPRAEPRRSDRAKRRRALEPSVEVLRLTDTGALVTRCHWTAVLDELSVTVTGKDGGPVPQVAILYVHGWRHNADAGPGGDLEKFSELIKRLSKEENSSERPRRVIGIYIGWDAATRVPLLEFLTFWPRQIAADRISQSAIVTKLLGAIENIRSIRKVNGDRVFLIGHSFGARILFAATSQGLIHKAQLAHPGNRRDEYAPIQGPADMILLLNPAIEASVFTAMDSIRRNWEDSDHKERFSKLQEPALVAITTTNDTATKWVFPVGQWLGLRRTEIEYRALGHHAAYRTHTLEKVAVMPPATSMQSSDWTAMFCEEQICLRRTDASTHNPFIVAQTTPDILNNHSGIWQPDFVDWTVRFFKKVDSRLAGKERPTAKP